jgi:uncharacterized protein YecE (DUF72 family)
VPSDFWFGLKVTDEITTRKFPNLDRFGLRAGKPNENFLNADLFATAFLTPCEDIRDKMGVLMFEFSRFYPTDYEHGRDFVADLNAFLGKLPKGWPYAIEMRNKFWLRDEYFACLARHGVTHVFNSWDAMPSVSEQMAMPGSRTNPELVAARFLLKPGRNYEDAVKARHVASNPARIEFVPMTVMGLPLSPGAGMKPVASPVAWIWVGLLSLISNPHVCSNVLW